MLTIQCPCGEAFHADERHIGYHVRCLRCGQVVPIALPASQQLDRLSSAVDLSREDVGGTAPPGRLRAWLGGKWAPALLVAGLLLVVGLSIGLLRGTIERPAVQRPIPLSKPLEEAAPEQQAPAPPDVQPRREFSPVRPPVSLPNGTIVYRRPGQPGLGQLTIHNGNPRDAAVTLLDPAPGRRVHLRVYVKAGQQAEVSSIAAGAYRIRFMLGVDWEGKRFARERQSFEFLDPIEFIERVTETGRKYRDWKVTLHAVPRGNRRFAPIPESDLEREDEG